MKWESNWSYILTINITGFADAMGNTVQSSKAFVTHFWDTEKHFYKFYN